MSVSWSVGRLVRDTFEFPLPLNISVHVHTMYNVHAGLNARSAAALNMDSMLCHQFISHTRDEKSDLPRDSGGAL